MGSPREWKCCCVLLCYPHAQNGEGGEQKANGASPQLQGLAGGLRTIPGSLQVGERDSRALCSWESTHSIVQQGWCPILEGEMTEGLPAVPVWLQVVFLSQFLGGREKGRQCAHRSSFTSSRSSSVAEILCHRYLLQSISLAH